ncbi:RNA-directed DNA polymerase, eukaryota [Tanacetum coccineum]
MSTAYHQKTDGQSERTIQTLEDILRANNDLNVLYGSLLFDDVLSNTTPEAPFVVNGRTYKKCYYLADGIYPTWSSFVKTFSFARDEKTLRFKRVQESARKDIERAFGVLQEEATEDTLFEKSEKKENNLDEEHKDKQEKNSEDPFNIYKLLKKKKDTTETEINLEQTMKYPPGFTLKEGSEEIGMYAEESKSVNFVNLSDHKAEEANKDGHGNCVNKNSNEDVSSSVCSGHFKKSGVPRTSGSILNFMYELVKVGQVMGYKMDGCMSNMTEIIESQGVKEKGDVVIMGDFNELKFLKAKIQEWNKSNMLSVKNVKAKYKEELEALEAIIDRGDGNEEIVNKRTEVVNNIQKFDKIHSSEMAQKAKVKWSIEGDENTSFFHGVLNKKRSILNIRGIMVDGNWIESPKAVKGEFFQHFSSRFDKPDASRATINMRYPKTLTYDQQNELESEVSNVEIKRAVWDCGTDKSPGPDGFTFGFYRRFWKIIENDVYDAVKYFFTYGNIPKGCNSSFIALIPKIPDANMVKDFRPISLIGSLYKIIAKILANRLVGVLGDIVNEVQSAFIAERQILDGPFILNEILQWSKTKKKQSLIFKVDFEKAYDSVRWDFLDDILKKFGFGEKWCKWIQSCLRSSRGSILINGSPTEEFQFYKGLKQGDPLSPFLFILIMESLHLSFQRVVDNGMFNGIKLSSSLSISHLFYADDAVFMGQWCDGNISTLIHVLECFYRASGLRINMSKSKILGVNVDSDKVKGAASKLGCLILKTPFTYLGSKVGGSMSRVHAWNEVIDRVKNRLSKWKMKTLSIGGRLTLLKSVLGSIPIFHMSIYRAPLSVLRTLESIRSKFFKGHDINSNKASWVNWKKVLASKEKGGLGVSSLFALNRGLMFKWIWRFYTQNTLLWVRVVKAIHGDDGNVGGHVKSGAKSCWLDIVRETHALKTKGINLLDCMHVKLGNGDKTVFWEDIWIDGKTLKNRFPRIYSLESCKLITVGAKLAQPSLEYSFRRNPRGGVEQDQFNELSALVHDVSLIPMSDRWKWDLESSGDFSVASVRKIIDDKSLSDVDSKTRWIKYVPIKVNVHAWKVKTDSLPTRFNVSRRGIDIDSIMCAICDNGVETSRHLFFYCCMVRQIVRKITRWWDVPYVEVESYEDWYNWLVNLRISSMHKQMFECVFYVMWWHLWSFRNKLIFDSKPPSQALFFDDVVLCLFIGVGIDVMRHLVGTIGLKTRILSLCNC